MKIRLFPCFLLLLLVASGCAPTQPKLRALWPMPPDEPRYEFLASYASQDDFPKTQAQVSSEAVFGKPQLDPFLMPFDLVVNSRGLIYISDQYLRNVRVYDLKAMTNHLLLEDANFFAQPNGVAIDKNDQVYIADAAAGCIQVISPDHVPVRTIRHPELVKPIYLVVDPGKELLYVSDASKNRIAVFTLQGELVKIIGEGKLYSPQGVAVTADGRLLVAEPLMARVSIFATDGNLLETYGERGDLPGQFDSPKDIAVGPDGRIYILDARKPGVITLDNDMQALLSIVTERSSTSPLALDSPAGIFVGDEGQLLIADRLKRRFSIWQQLTPAYLAVHPITEADLAAIKKLQEDQALKRAQEAKEKK